MERVAAFGVESQKLRSVQASTVMESQYWQRPVEIELHGVGKYRTITGTKHAAECLLTLWPVDDGLAYQKALSDCLAALEGEKPPEMARKAFIKAADEAHIHIRKH